LAKTLQGLGMTTAFSPEKANFSRITEKSELCISAVLHKTFLNVNEEGTEAAAATAIAMKLESEPMEIDEPIFRADHPFMFLIRHNKTGAILFIGSFLEP
jgi:serpin B